jgi:uncharacterized damage-inducible protein DinB
MHSTSCRSLQPLLAGYVDRETSPEQNLLIESHLESCETCRHRVETQRAVRKLLRGRAVDARTHGGVPSWRPRSERADRSRAWRIALVGAAAVPAAAVLVVFLRAGRPDAGDSGRPAQPAASETSLSVGLQNAYARIKRDLTEAAEKLSEAEYVFTPNPEIRTYGQLFGHVANFHYQFCSTAKGEPNPNQGIDLEKKTSREEFLTALTESFAYCDEVFSSLTDKGAIELVKQRQSFIARGSLASSLVAHDNEMYGTAAVYLRLKGRVPPSTERERRRAASLAELPDPDTRPALSADIVAEPTGVRVRRVNRQRSMSTVVASGQEFHP